MPTWTDTERFKLLLSIIELSDKSKLPPWVDVARKMGVGYTAEAVRQQYQKIRKTGSSGSGAGAALTPTPKKRQASRKNKRADDELQDDEEFPETPTKKKIKRESLEADFPAIKTEPVDANGAVIVDDDDLYT